MKGMFVRLFLSLWVSMTAVAAAFVLIENNSVDDPVHEERRQALLTSAIRQQALAIVGSQQSAQERAAALRRFEDETDVAIFVFLPDGRLIADRHPSKSIEELARRVREGGYRAREKDSARLVGFELSDDGTVVVGRIRRIATWTHALGLETVAQKIFVVLLMSGFLSYLLAQYLSRPVRALRRATQRVASGDLSVRVDQDVGSVEELVDLAQDFDRMVDRVQHLVSGQQRLLADVSHELNSPLARLRVALELARQQGGPNEPLDRIERECERLADLVAQILTLTRLEQRETANRVEFDLAALVRRIGSDADYEARAEDRGVDVVGADHPILIEGDPEIIRRAIENVVRNAVRFTPPNTQVEVGLEVSAGSTQVKVSDHGPGVPEDELSNIFEPLYRIDGHRARKTGGTGLGLAITRRAVDAHEGTVVARNRPGGGLHVEMSLPPGGHPRGLKA